MGAYRAGQAGGLGDQGRRTAAIIAGIGVLAILAVFGAWWLLSRETTLRPGAEALSAVQRTHVGQTIDQGGLVAAAPSETFAVPTPSFVTPTLSEALGALEAEIPGESPDGTPTVAVPAPAPPPPASTPAQAPPKPPTATPVTVRDLALQCQLQGRKVRATLSFVSTGPVSVSITAGDEKKSGTASGSVRVDVVGNAERGRATCLAVVNGQRIGPLAAV